MLSVLHKHAWLSSLIHFPTAAFTICQKCLQSCRRGRVGHKRRFICFVGVDPDHMGNLGEVLKGCFAWFGGGTTQAQRRFAAPHQHHQPPHCQLGTTSTTWACLWGSWETPWIFPSLAHHYSAASSLSAASNTVFADSLLTGSSEFCSFLHSISRNYCTKLHSHHCTSHLHHFLSDI